MVSFRLKWLRKSLSLTCGLRNFRLRRILSISLVNIDVLLLRTPCVHKAVPFGDGIKPPMPSVPDRFVPSAGTRRGNSHAAGLIVVDQEEPFYPCQYPGPLVATLTQSWGILNRMGGGMLRDGVAPPKQRNIQREKRYAEKDVHGAGMMSTMENLSPRNHGPPSSISSTNILIFLCSSALASSVLYGLSGVCCIIL